jgi:hypothetical protein
VYVVSNDKVIEYVKSLTLKKALWFKVESTTGCEAIKFGNHFDEVIDHMKSSTLKKESRLKVESRKSFPV